MSLLNCSPASLCFMGGTGRYHCELLSFLKATTVTLRPGRHPGIITTTSREACSLKKIKFTTKHHYLKSGARTLEIWSYNINTPAARTRYCQGQLAAPRLH